MRLDGIVRQRQKRSKYGVVSKTAESAGVIRVLGRVVTCTEKSWRELYHQLGYDWGQFLYHKSEMH